MTSNKANLLALINRNSQQIKLFGVKRLRLFGSFVRDTVSTESDVDFLVEFEQGQKTFDNFMNLSFFMENLLGRKVELLMPQSLSKYIAPHILAEVEDVL
jgi:uncharacterized protein